jgi:hypothetical protein
VYDETIQVLHTAVEKAKLGNADRSQAIKNLHLVSKIVEQQFVPDEELFDKAIARERKDSHRYGGRTVFGKAKPPKDDGQLSLF